MTLFGALQIKTGWRDIASTFEWVASRFSDCESFEYEVPAAGVSGDLGYIAGVEHTTAAIADAAAQAYALRVTTVFRREDASGKSYIGTPIRSQTVSRRTRSWPPKRRATRSIALARVQRHDGTAERAGQRRTPDSTLRAWRRSLERIGAGRFVSFELWPPRSAESASALEAALDELAGLGPAFVAISYGAGGSTRERTHDLVVRLVDSSMLPLARLTCAAHGRAELVDLMRRYRRAGVDNLHALHGDPPLSASEELPEGDLRYAVDLVRLARDLGCPGVGVALHPEGHPAATSRQADWEHQAAKLREADFGPTQFFHRADDYFALVEEMRARGADAPVVPGVMPITTVRQVERMAAMSGTSIPDELGEKLLAVADRPDVVRQVGVEHATLLCHRLLDGGAPGLR